MNIAGFRKALPIGKGLAVVDHHDLKSRDASHPIHVEPDVPGAEYIDRRNRKQRLNKSFERPAACQAGIVLRILFQIEGKRARLFPRDDLGRRLPYLGLDRAATDGAYGHAIVAHQQFGRFQGGTGADDGCQGGTAAFPAPAHQFVVDIHHGRTREKRLNEDFQRAPANQTGVVFGIFVQVESQGAWLSLLNDLAGGLPHFGLDAAAADAACHGAIVANQHLGGFKGRYGAAHADNGRQRGATALTPPAHQLFVDIHSASIADHASGKDRLLQCFLSLYRTVITCKLQRNLSKTTSDAEAALWQRNCAPSKR